MAAWGLGGTICGKRQLQRVGSAKEYQALAKRTVLFVEKGDGCDARREITAGYSQAAQGAVDVERGSAKHLSPMMKQQVRLSVAGGAGHETQQQGLVISVRICPKHNACFPCRGQSNLFGCAVVDRKSTRLNSSQ